MTITRANAEAEIVARVGAWMTAAGLAVTTAGANASLNSPIGWAIRLSGGSVSAPALITSTDVQTVADADLDKFYDLAELRTLETVLSNYTGVDKKAGPVELKSSQMGDRLLAVLDRKRAQIAADYGIGSYGAFSVALTRTDGYSELAAE